MFGGVEGANGGDWEKSLRSSVLQKGIEELSRFSERVWGSSAWQASLSTGNLPFAPSQQSLDTLSSVAEFAESGDELTPAGLSLDGKVGVRRQNMQKALPVLHTPISSPSSNETKDLYKTRLTLWCTLVGWQWIPVSWEKLAVNHESICLPHVHQKLHWFLLG